MKSGVWTVQPAWPHKAWAFTGSGPRKATIGKPQNSMKFQVTKF